MGSTTFVKRAEGKTAREAFNKAVQDALFEHGHGGYTGTIAEKKSFTVIPLPPGKEAHAEIERLIDACDPRIDDKWGPAGCFELGGGKYIFFGWASD